MPLWLSRNNKPTMRCSPSDPPGRVLAVDPGTVRVGLAISDPMRITAQPWQVLPWDEQTVTRLAELVQEQGVTDIVVGYPVGMRGQQGSGTEQAQMLAKTLTKQTEAKVHLWDERFSSRMAEQMMLTQRASRRTRKQHKDQVAAALILSEFLECQDPERELVIEHGEGELSRVRGDQK